MSKAARTLEESFRQAIREQPDDDTPRLIFADWLDEHGQPERAEFIRTQIEQARLPEYTPKARLLEERWRTLLHEHGAGWEAEIRSVCQRIGYKRGCVEWVGFDSLGDFLRAADRVFAPAPIRRLTIDKPWRRTPRWSDCPYLGRLRGLGLGSDDFRTRWSERSLTGALSPPALCGLEDLDLMDVKLGREAARAVAGAVHLAGLKTLILYGSSIGLRGAEDLTRASHLRTLEKLDLSGNNIGDWGLQALAGSAVMANLRELHLGNEADYDRRNDLGPVGARFLTASPYLTRLRVLDLYKNDLGDEGAERLASWEGLASVADLNLAATGLSDACLEALAASPHAAGLVRLGLAYNDITDRGLQALLESPHLARLEGLRIDYELREAMSDTLWQAVVERFGYGLEEH
jgi:uncharacterized protein (TIGR02996 family)